MTRFPVGHTTGGPFNGPFGRAEPRITIMEAVLPQRLWRKLLSPPRLDPFSRVLVTGPQPIELATWLSELGFEVTVACDDAGTLFEGRRTAPRVEFLYIKPGAKSLLAPHSCDAAFLQPLTSHGENWLSLESRWVTAGLVSAVRPQGHVMTLHTPNLFRSDHDDECWNRHLGCFPGRIASLVDSPLAFWSRRTETRVTSWQLPPELLSLDDWREFARRGLLTGQRVCCEGAQRDRAMRRAA